MQAALYEVLYYIYILIFGVYVSLRIAHGALTTKTWRVFAALCPVLLLLQGICLHVWDLETVRRLYPLITHLPIILACILLLDIRWDMALVSVVISYSLCQLPRWAGLVISAFEPAPVTALIIHLAVSQGILLLLGKYCLGAIHELVHGFHHPLLRIGALPVIYYLYEYFMVYTSRRYIHVLALSEFLPTGLVLFFILFVIAYRHETEERTRAERQNTALEMRLDYAEQQLSMLRTLQEQTAIYRHDLHHHLMMIDSLLSAGRQEQAFAYIRTAQSEIDAFTPVRFCENETVNLLLGAFQSRAEARGATLAIKAVLPGELALPDTELCALLSNGLENAVNAVVRLPESSKRRIELYCGIKQSKLLIEIRNPYAGELILKDGLPQSPDQAHGYGCRSIQSIVHRHRGMCTFEAAQGEFILRVAVPMK